MVEKISVEEHVLCPGLVDYWLPTVADLDRSIGTRLYSRLNDFGEQRLNAMDAAGIARAVLSVAGPGVQAEPDAARATQLARDANDFLAREIAKRPARYLGFAHLAMQEPRAAADELERCVRELGFRGAMINGHSNGLYLDHPSCEPLWERASDLAVPVFLHPADPLVPAPALDGMPALRGATWEWGFEAASHALRLIFAGVFARHPRARIILSQLGEALPYVMTRLDRGARLHGVALERPPSQALKENVLVTTSGLTAVEPLYCAIAALGPQHVLFGTDYPFESADDAGHFLDTVRLDEGTRAEIARRNAVAALALPDAPQG